MRGFTLIELVMIIVVIGVLAIVAAPRFNLGGFQNTEVRTQLIQGIRYAQFQSIYHTGSAAYQISVNSNGFQISQGGITIADPYNTSSGYTRSWPDASISPTGSISFNGRGEPSCTPASLCNSSDLTFTISISGDSSNVTMEQFTGFVH